MMVRVVFRFLVLISSMASVTTAFLPKAITNRHHLAATITTTTRTRSNDGNNNVMVSLQLPSLFMKNQQEEVEIDSSSSRETDVVVVPSVSNPISFKTIMAGWSGFGMGLLSSISAVLAEQETEDIELIDLPPPYVPVIFAVGILVGVGLLTLSLGDVMTEEASLGIQSGTRAKKDIERGRSSYFKKKD